MDLFKGKSPAERNKLIAAMVLGALAIASLLYTFSGFFIGGKKSSSASNSNIAAPAPGSPGSDQANKGLPNEEDINEYYSSSPVLYDPGFFSAPDAGRNIFAFYEPPPFVPTPYVPPPPKPQTPTPTPPPPIPTPTPPLMINFMNTNSVYAGSKAFRLEVNGGPFTPETFIFMNGSQMPTNFISAQQLTAEVPANLIANAGTVQIMVRSASGVLYSDPTMIQVNAPPRPQFTYIGMIARSRYNNDTAYLIEQGRQTPTSARLNDTVGGRFKMMSISPLEVVVVDKDLGFRHRIALERPKSGQGGSGGKNPNGQPGGIPGIPGGIPQPYPYPGQSIPGIPDNIPRAEPQVMPQQQNKKDYDEDDEDGGN